MTELSGTEIETETETKNYLLGLLSITNAAITPGTQPQSHKRKTINMEPHPLPITAKGGQIIDNKTLQKLMLVYDFRFTIYDYLFDEFVDGLLHFDCIL